MIIFDTETTNLTSIEASPIAKQPHIVEFAALKLCDKTFAELQTLDFLCSLPPGVDFPPEAQKITGLNPAMLAGKPPFSANVNKLSDFFLGERILLAHNLPFDVTVTRHELSRLSRVTSFPWPPRQICTVEATVGLRGHRLNLGLLHEIATGAPHTGAHRAMADVRALATCVKWLITNGYIVIDGCQIPKPKGKK